MPQHDRECGMATPVPTMVDRQPLSSEVAYMLAAVTLLIAFLAFSSEARCQNVLLSLPQNALGEEIVRCLPSHGSLKDKYKLIRSASASGQTQVVKDFLSIHSRARGPGALVVPISPDVVLSDSFRGESQNSIALAFSPYYDIPNIPTVSLNWTDIGKIQGETVKSQLPGGSDVLLLNFAPISSDETYRRSINEVLGETSYNITTTAPSFGNEAEIENVLRDFATMHGRRSEFAVIAGDTKTTEYLLSKKWDFPAKFFGLGTTTEILRGIQSGDLNSTVDTGMCRLMVDSLLAVFESSTGTAPCTPCKEHKNICYPDCPEDFIVVPIAVNKTNIVTYKQDKSED